MFSTLIAGIKSELGCDYLDFWATLNLDGPRASWDEAIVLEHSLLKPRFVSNL